MGTIATAPRPGAAYATTFEAPIGQRGMTQGGTSDKLRNRLVMEEHERIRRQGFEPCTVLNLNTFPLTVGLGDMGTMDVPARAAGERFAVAVIDKPRISMRDSGDGNFTPVSSLPSDLAAEFVREYQDCGGVAWFRGEGKPPEAMIEEASAKLMAHYRLAYKKAVDQWSRYHQHKFITDRQRDAARALHASGEISNLPEWVEMTKEMSTVTNCVSCGEQVQKTAKICRHCRYVLDTEWAASNQSRFAGSAPGQQAAKPEPPRHQGGQRQ